MHVFRLAGALLALTASFAQAQALREVTVQASPDPALSLTDPVPTASRLPLPLREVPGSADVIEQSQMQARGARTVVDAVQSATGLTGAVRAGAPGVYQSRGFIENAVSVQFDGIRIGATTVYTRPYDSFNFDRIEVLRGPASALHGDSAVGGAINYVHRRPTFGPVGYEVLGSVSRFDRYRVAAAARGGLTENLGFNLSLAGNRGDSFVDGVETDDLHLLGSLLLRLGTASTLLLEVDHLRSRVDDAYWGTPLVGGRIDDRLRSVNYNRAPDNRYDDDVTWLRAAFDHRFANGLASRTTLYWYAASRDWRNFAAPRFDGGVPARVTIREVEDLLYDATTLGLRQELNGEARLGAMPWWWSVGADLQRNEFDSPRFQAGPTAIAVDAFAPGSRSFAAFAGPRNRLRASEVDNLAVFTDHALGLTPALKLHLGARWDALDVTTRFQNPPAAAPTVTERSFRVANVRAGVSWTVAEPHTVYAAIATGAEPIDGSAYAFISPADLARTDLTRARQLEVGSKHVLLGGRLQATTAVYDIERRDIFTADPANPSGPRQQIGQQSSRGLELAAAWRPDAQWTLSGSAAFVDAEYDTFVSGGVNLAGRTPRMVPSRVFSLGVQYRPFAPLELGAFVKHVSSVYLNDDNSVSLPSWTRLDLSARWQFSRTLDAALVLRNATDALYADWGIQFLGAQVVNLAPPRALELQVRARF